VANIQLNHEGVNQAVADMQQATSQIESALDDLMQQLRPLAESFTGQSASAWAQFQNAVNTAETAMSADFGKGSTVLDTMHGHLADGDKRGAAILGA
jgi:WXG100 family type VII secretion target